MKEILEKAKRNPKVRRFLEDYSFRTILTTILGVAVNAVYAVYNGFIGVTMHSAWFITMAVYYGILMAMRYQALSAQRKITHTKDNRQIRAKQNSVLKSDGILLLVLNLALSGVILLTIAQDTAKRYSEIMVITIAAYTFCRIVIAIRNMIKVQKMNSPVLVAIRNIGVAHALVSMLTLQATMLASLQKKSALNANQMNAITGLAVCILIAALGIHMIYLSYEKP